MSDRSKIEWTDATWNPVTGCTKVSAGCANCYAERMVKRLPMVRGRHGFDGDGDALPFSAVTCHHDRLNQPRHWRKPRRVVVCSMGDLFHKHVTDEFIGRVFGVMGIAERHTFQVLTKRPERALEWIRSRPRDPSKPSQSVVPCEFGDLSYSLPWPLPNVWLGTSVENQTAADERIPLLIQTPAAVRFVSCEPLLGPVSLRWMNAFPENVPYTAMNPSGVTDEYDGLRRLDWIICGDESGPNARPMHPDWARSLRDQSKAAGVPFFFKQWGEWAPDCWCATDRPHRTTVRPEPGKPGVMFRCGKQSAGRTLDGKIWEQYPEASK